MTDTGTMLAREMMLSAVRWAEVEGRTEEMSLRADEVCEAMRRLTGRAISEGMADAKAAADAGMMAVAQATLLASVRLAGIAAAKSVMNAEAEARMEKIRREHVVDPRSTCDCSACRDARGKAWPEYHRQGNPARTGRSAYCA